MNSPDDWKGDERRSIPIHVLNYIKEIVTEETVELKTSFDEYKRNFAAHDHDEMARYDAILQNQIANAKESADRHYALVDSLTASMGRIQLAETAFIKNHNGDPDFHGHREAHEVWIAESIARKEFWNKMKFELAKWGFIGFLGWGLVQLWLGVLHGPSK